MKNNYIPYDIALNQHLIHIFSEYENQNKKIKEFKLENIFDSRFYFLTATYLPFEEFNDQHFPISPQKCFTSFQKFYLHMISQMMNHPERNRELQPLAYAYLDYPTTKTTKKYANLPKFQKMKINRRLLQDHPELSPHIHAVILVHPELHDSFEAIIGDLELLFSGLDKINRTLEIEHLPGISDVIRTMGYSSKWIRKNTVDLKGIDPFIVLPTSKSEPVYAKKKHEKDMEQKMRDDRAFRNRHRDNYKAKYFNRI